MTDRLIVLGASMGGVETLCELLPRLPETLGAAVLIVVHTSSRGGGGALSKVLGGRSLLPVKQAQDGEPIRMNQVYLPPSDHHLLVQEKVLRVSHGPRENNSRPAIDPLFRTAAYYARERCLGVVLSGMLDDGSGGLWAVQQCGGLTFIQEPAEARFPDMPRNALRLVQPDYRLRLGELAESLVQAVRRPPPPPPKEIPLRLRQEVLLTLRAMGLEAHAMDIDLTDELGEPVPISCPECGGTLWQVGEHFRCHVGHGYSRETLMLCQDRNLEQALWAAVRALEEKRKTLEKILRQDSGSQGEIYASRTEDAQRHADHIRELLLRMAGSD